MYLRCLKKRLFENTQESIIDLGHRGPVHLQSISQDAKENDASSFTFSKATPKKIGFSCKISRARKGGQNWTRTSSGETVVSCF